MTSQEIRGLLVAKGIYNTDIARRAQKHPSLVTYVIQNKSKNPKIRKLIANALGKKVSELWPVEIKKKSQKKYNTP